jgi:hypothetical protein
MEYFPGTIARSYLQVLCFSAEFILEPWPRYRHIVCSFPVRSDPDFHAADLKGLEE